MYDVDVNGTQMVLQAAADAGTQQVLVTSSATAYGAFPDNPKPIAEDWPVRGAPDFSYAKDKADADRICQLWAAEHPDRVMTIVRPCIVLGPSVDNYIVRSFDEQPVRPGARRRRRGVPARPRGRRRLGPDRAARRQARRRLQPRRRRRSSPGGSAAEMIGKKTREVSLKNMKRFAGTMWRLHVPRTEAPPGNLDFLRYPWVVSTEKLKSDDRLAAALRHPRDLQDHDAGEGPARGRAGASQTPTRAGRLAPQAPLLPFAAPGA